VPRLLHKMTEYSLINNTNYDAIEMLKRSCASEIILSLKYLFENNFDKELNDTIRLTLELCCSSEKIDINKLQHKPFLLHKINPKHLIASLEYLQMEAKRHHLFDVEMIINACVKMSLCTYYYKLRKEFFSLEDGILENKIQEI
jgi:hypothetical protein